MSFKFNPFTLNFDYFETGTSSGISFSNKSKVVDSAFLSDRKITLDSAPLEKGELVFLNGLLMGTDCYDILGSEITFQPTIPFKVGHFIDIRFAT